MQFLFFRKRAYNIIKSFSVRYYTLLTVFSVYDMIKPIQTFKHRTVSRIPEIHNEVNKHDAYKIFIRYSGRKYYFRTFSETWAAYSAW